MTETTNPSGPSALLTPVEARVLGTLMEKARTVPDSYPLTLNALISGCNQKTTRDPIMELSEADVAQALNTLQERNLVTRFSVGENIMLERLGSHALSRIDYDALHEEAAKWLRLLDLDVDPRMAVSRLSVAQMQLVEIGKALSLQSPV